MNAHQAKHLSLPHLLHQLGHQPIKTLKSGQELWYKSPFRTEQEASFHTSYLGGKWIWNDFGDTGGTVLDFAMRYYNTDVKDALRHLERLMGSFEQNLFPASALPKAPPTVVPPTDEPETLSLRKVSPLSVDSIQGKALLDYLTHKRGIDAIIAAKYLLEVHYRNTHINRDYFAAGMLNELGGYEIRNVYFKSSIGPKGVTLIKGKKQGHVGVFEGFIDFLSALTYYQSIDLGSFQELVQGDTLIMNSASFQRRTKELLQAPYYTKLSLYLDNDKTGHQVRDSIGQQSSLPVVDGSSMYESYKDFNEFLLANRT